MMLPFVDFIAKLNFASKRGKRDAVAFGFRP